MDRLVDGEMSSENRRTLLERIEQENAWRSLALAFLEAQAWQSDLRAMTLAEPKPVAEPMPQASPNDEKPLRPTPWLRPELSLLALAAGLLLAFSLGFALGPTSGFWSPEAIAPDDGPRMADSLPQPDPEPRDEPQAPGPALVERNSDARALNVTPVRFFEIELADGRANQPLRVPVAQEHMPENYQQLIHAWDRTRLPDLKRRLASLGQELREERVRVPIELGGGRTGWLTYYEIAVTPVEFDPYQ
jgi:hypothetical protein